MLFGSTTVASNRHQRGCRNWHARDRQDPPRTTDEDPEDSAGPDRRWRASRQGNLLRLRGRLGDNFGSSPTRCMVAMSLIRPQARRTQRWPSGACPPSSRSALRSARARWSNATPSCVFSVETLGVPPSSARQDWYTHHQSDDCGGDCLSLDRRRRAQGAPGHWHLLRAEGQRCGSCIARRRGRSGQGVRAVQPGGDPLR